MFYVIFKYKSALILIFILLVTIFITVVDFDSPIFEPIDRNYWSGFLDARKRQESEQPPSEPEPQFLLQKEPEPLPPPQKEPESHHHSGQDLIRNNPVP